MKKVVSHYDPSETWMKPDWSQERGWRHEYDPTYWDRWYGHWWNEHYDLTRDEQNKYLWRSYQKSRKKSKDSLATLGLISEESNRLTKEGENWLKYLFYEDAEVQKKLKDLVMEIRDGNK